MKLGHKKTTGLSMWLSSFEDFYKVHIHYYVFKIFLYLNTLLLNK